MGERASYLVVFLSAACLLLPSAGWADLVARWSMDDDGSGVVVDSSGNGLDGTLMGDAHFVEGLFGQAVQLTNTDPDNYFNDDYVEITGWTGVGGTEPRSVAAWVNTSYVAGTHQTIVCWGTAKWNAEPGTQFVDFRIWKGILRFETLGDRVKGLSSVVDGEWHHVAVTITDDAYLRDDDVKLWLDGADDTDTSSYGGTGYPIDTIPGIDVSIGRRTWSDQTLPDRYFSGLIDDCRIFDHELSAEEVASLAAGVITVAIDIKPGDDLNSINPNAGGVIPVAILTTGDFDASTIDPATVQLEGVNARGKGKSGKYGSLEDVDGDNDSDLIVQIENVIEWAPAATVATVTGLTWDGIPVEGTDSVNIVPPQE